MSNSMHKEIVFILSWTAVFAWLLLIFSLSAQPAEQSNNLSNGITEIIVETVKKVAPKAELDLQSFNYYVRKNAHFFAYLLLGILMMNSLKQSGVRGTRAYVIAFLCCMFFAGSDEVHQLFVPGRSGQIRDVLIDSEGALVGIGVYAIGGKIRRCALNDRR